jgi:hypothetical protein
MPPLPAPLSFLKVRPRRAAAAEAQRAVVQDVVERAEAEFLRLRVQRRKDNEPQRRRPTYPLIAAFRWF